MNSAVKRRGASRFLATRELQLMRDKICSERAILEIKREHSAIHYCDRTMAGNYDLNSAFEKADRLLEQKHTSSKFNYIAPLSL